MKCMKTRRMKTSFNKLGLNFNVRGRAVDTFTGVPRDHIIKLSWVMLAISFSLSQNATATPSPAKGEPKTNGSSSNETQQENKSDPPNPSPPTTRHSLRRNTTLNSAAKAETAKSKSNPDDKKSAKASVTDAKENAKKEDKEKNAKKDDEVKDAKKDGGDVKGGEDKSKDETEQEEESHQSGVEKPTANPDSVDSDPTRDAEIVDTKETLENDKTKDTVVETNTKDTVDTNTKHLADDREVKDDKTSAKTDLETTEAADDDDDITEREYSHDTAVEELTSALARNEEITICKAGESEVGNRGEGGKAGVGDGDRRNSTASVEDGKLLFSSA